MKKRVKKSEVDALSSFFTLHYLYREERLADLRAGFDVVLHGGDTDGAIPILGGENHAFTDETVLELTRSKVGNEEHLLADELFWLIPLADTADDGAFVESIVDEELEELLHLWHAFTFKDSSHADVELLEVVEADGFLDWGCLCVGSEVCLASGFQFVELELDDIIFNLFEKE